MTKQNDVQIVLRLAEVADVPTLTKLIDSSVRGLQHGDYSQAQIDSALRTVYGVDSQLINDGTYFVAEVVGEPPLIVGCGGWSKRKTLYGGDQFHAREDSFSDPSTDAAKIRAFFIHPEWVRLGIGSRILEACEDAAIAGGFRRLEMGSTLTGVALYSAKGYVSAGEMEVPLEDGLALPIVRMTKTV
ncbi:MAG: GNAT family N-acetyltransferase [Candidatus Melainabacteria bacterium]|nr:GNAT family N-acetyltransferase [Candidatus Melainabacteria bacterium]